MELRDEDAEIVYDYTKKGGVVHKEIILPENAPPEYADRESLWNAVEAKEIRKDARLAREIEAALQTEFDLRENVELLREYLKENFVARGMIVDFAIHNNEGNPHVHVMLTTREVTPEGFGKKNRDWDKEENLLIWRENWAKINNRKFEEKGIEERIDHRTLKAQGIDREPTVHVGHKAWALEKKGIQTERGDYNREVKRRNEERAVKKAERAQKLTENVKNETSAIEPATEKTAQNIDEMSSTITFEVNPPERQKETSNAERTDARAARTVMREIEEHLKAEKAAQIVEKLYEKREARREEAKKIAQYMSELKKNYVERNKELSSLLRENQAYKQEIPQLTYLAENMDEHIKNIETIRDKAAQIQKERQNLSFWDGKRKKELDREIEHTEKNIKLAQHHFKQNFGIDPDQAPNAIKRTIEKIREKEEALNRKTAQIAKIREHQAAIELEYQTQKLLAEIHPERQHIEKTLEKMNKTPESVRDRLQQEQYDYRLNTITKENFQKVIENLPQHQAQTLIEQRKRAETIEQEQEKIKERTISIERVH